MDHGSDKKESFEWREAEEAEVDPFLLKERTESTFIHNLMKGSLKWSRECPEMKTTLYLPVERRWQGSVLITIKGQGYIVAFFSPHSSYSFLMSALMDKNIVDWKKAPMLFYDLPYELLTPFEESLIAAGVPILGSWHFHKYWLDINEAKKMDFSVPEGFRIAPLERKHAPQVNNVWPYASQESLKLVQDMIKIYPTVGIFVGDELVSWVLQTYYGLGMLHTIDEYRKRGLGELAVRIISKYVGDDGDEPNLLVRVKNEPAHIIFKRLGYSDLGFLGALLVGSG